MTRTLALLRHVARDMVPTLIAIAIVVGLAMLVAAVLPAHAGDSVPAIQWAIEPPEPEYWVWIDAQPLFPLWRRCGIETPCSVPYQREPDPAPVPLPPTLLLLTAAIAALAMKGKRT